MNTKNKAFIHISDLHIANDKLITGEQNSRYNLTWLHSSDDRISDDYISDFCEYINHNLDDNAYEIYLLITGDIADSSEKVEYNKALKYLKQIITKLKIGKENILLIPGNHDINRYECTEAARKCSNENKKSYEFHDEKYTYFSDFYEEFFDNAKKFDSKKQIVDKLILCEEKILILGINSNYKIGCLGGTGSLNFEEFEDELKKELEFLNRESYKEWVFIAIFHHNILNEYNESKELYGSWEKTDWVKLKKILDKFQFKCVFYGNEHTRSSSKMTNHDEVSFYCSDSGSFALKKPLPSFKIYELFHDDNETYFKNTLYLLIDAKKKEEEEYGKWAIQRCDDVDEFEKFILRQKPTIKLDKNTEIDGFCINNQNDCITNGMYKEEIPLSPITTSKDENCDNHADACEEKKYPLVLPNDYFQNGITRIIKSGKLYHQGHFHWGLQARSHNWIDTTSLLSKRENVIIIQKEIEKKINDNGINYDFIIGLGIQGNIMASSLLTKDKPYSFMPYTFRYDEANEYEKEICFKNDNIFKHVLIITDVVFSGNMLENLVKDKASNFFEKVDTISIISLFYSGNNINDQPEGLIKITDKNINFYPLAQLEVERCSFGDDFKQNCVIYKEHLCDVYKFYNGD